MKRILVSAGDLSGDLILAGIIRHLKAQYPQEKWEFIGLCGPAAEQEGVQALAHSQDVAVVGISEVARNIKKIYGVLDRLKAELPRCEAVLCVDFPDFNLKLAALAAEKKVPVDFVIAPQVWAWRGARLPKIRRLVRRLYPALPFEEPLFTEAGVDARFLGHPIRDLLPPKSRRQARQFFGLDSQAFFFCIMPGSRRSEIERHLPLLMQAWEEYQQLEVQRERMTTKGTPHPQALLPLAPGWTEEGLLKLLKPKEQAHFKSLVETRKEWKCVTDSRKALMAADFGWITSGTATLEAGLYQLPHILLYRLSGFSAFLIRLLSHYFTDRNAAAGLPNILLEKNVIPELLQGNLSAKRLAIETYELLHDPIRLHEMGRSLRYLPKKLGSSGAIARIAEDLRSLWTRSK